MTSRLHFKRIAARAMRQVLVEAARRRNARKRGQGAVPVTFDEGLPPRPDSSDEVLALDAALEALRRPRVKRVTTSFPGRPIPR